LTVFNRSSGSPARAVHHLSDEGVVAHLPQLNVCSGRLNSVVRSLKGSGLIGPALVDTASVVRKA
jgi:hypothetical protein